MHLHTILWPALILSCSFFKTNSLIPILVNESIMKTERHLSVGQNISTSLNYAPSSTTSVTSRVCFLACSNNLAEDIFPAKSQPLGLGHAIATVHVIEGLREGISKTPGDSTKQESLSLKACG
jgi:hypothetical protein